MIEAAPARAMQAFLGAALRQTYRPVAAAQSATDAEITALCRRIERIGGDRQGRPFHHHDRAP